MSKAERSSLEPSRDREARTGDPSRSADTWPIVVLQDRYRGTYSGGAWLAISVADRLENGSYRVVRCLETGPSDDDSEAQAFWLEPPSWIAVGDTPDEAVRALHTRTADNDAAILHRLDRDVEQGAKDLDAGRVHTADEVRTYLRDRTRRGLDAAE